MKALLCLRAASATLGLPLLVLGAVACDPDRCTFDSHAVASDEPVGDRDPVTADEIHADFGATPAVAEAYWDEAVRPSWGSSLLAAGATVQPARGNAPLTIEFDDAVAPTRIERGGACNGESLAFDTIATLHLGDELRFVDPTAHVFVSAQRVRLAASFEVADLAPALAIEVPDPEWTWSVLLSAELTEPGELGAASLSLAGWQGNRGGAPDAHYLVAETDRRSQFRLGPR